MALVDLDSWSTEYESCKRLSQMLSGQLQTRDNRQFLSPEYQRLTNSLQIGLKQFETELHQLKDKTTTPNLNKYIPQNEIDSRLKQIELLHTELKYLQLKFNNSSRDELMGTSRNTTTTIGMPEPPILITNDVNNLKQSHIDILEQQNRGLEALSATVSRQRNLASQLGQEVEDQNEILDNLAHTMDRVDSRVNVETSNISQIHRRDSTWGYWLIIILLFIGIVLVILL